MFSVDVVVNILHQSLFRVLISRFQLLPDCVLLHFKMVVVVNAITKHISKYLYRFRKPVREAQHVVQSVLTRVYAFN